MVAAAAIEGNSVSSSNKKLLTLQAIDHGGCCFNVNVVGVAIASVAFSCWEFVMYCR